MRHPISASARTSAGWLLAALLAGSVGCSTLGPTRGQAPDEGDSKFDLKEVQTVGDVTEVSNAGPLQVSGVGLVTGLEGTGGGAPPGMYRTMLQEQPYWTGAACACASHQNRFAAGHCAIRIGTRGEQCLHHRVAAVIA